MDKAEDKVQLTIFKASLKSKEFVVAFIKNPLDSMTKMLLKAQKYMNVEDALTAIGMEDIWKERRYVQEDSKGKKRERRDYSSNHDNAKSKNDKTRRMVNFIPLVMPINKILMQIDDRLFKWSKPRTLHLVHVIRSSIVISIEIMGTTQMSAET